MIWLQYFYLILKRLKTGGQWRELPIESYFEKGESTGYQARKKSVTTNSIFLYDNNGQMIAMGSPKAGNHNDLYEIEEVLKEILAFLEEAGSLF